MLRKSLRLSKLTTVRQENNSEKTGSLSHSVTEEKYGGGGTTTQATVNAAGHPNWCSSVCSMVKSRANNDTETARELQRLMIRRLWWLLFLNAIACGILFVAFTVWGILAAMNPNNKSYSEAVEEEAKEYNPFSDMIGYLAILINGIMGYYSRAGRLSHAGMTRDTPKS